MKIQELSDMGEARQAKLIKEFVDSELVPGHIPSDIRFDDAYAKWRQERVQVAIDAYADKWGLDASCSPDQWQNIPSPNPNLFPISTISLELWIIVVRIIRLLKVHWNIISNCHRISLCGLRKQKRSMGKE